MWSFMLSWKLCSARTAIDFGSSEQTINYDSEETLYNTWFAELDEIVANLSANTEFTGLAPFDASYGTVAFPQKLTLFICKLKIRCMDGKVVLFCL